MLLKKIEKYIYSYNSEILEFDLEYQVNNTYKKSKIILFKVLIKKIFRSFYRFLQRSLIKPQIREIIIYVERIFLKIISNKIKISHDQNVINKTILLKRDSYVEIENIFNQDELLKIREYFMSKKDLVNIFESTSKKKMDMQYYKTEDLISFPLIIRGANNEYLNQLLSNYFECSYRLDWIWAWWSYADEKNPSIGPQNFHRDYESFNFVKVFVYLTDVDGTDGSHQLICGSHKENKLYEIKRFSDDEISNNFNSIKIKNIDGKSGKTFVANTFAIHKGVKPFRNNRLILCYLFSVVPSRRSPKLPVINFSSFKSDRDLLKKNQYINSLFINYNK